MVAVVTNIVIKHPVHYHNHLLIILSFLFKKQLIEKLVETLLKTSKL